MTRNEAYDRMSALLDQVQAELMGRNWNDERLERIERGSKLRGDLFQAICDYAGAREKDAVLWR